jgi:RNA polymerase sigma factor (sigma-70 family)
MTDCKLMKAYASNGDEAAFTELAHRHTGMVYRVCRAMVGEADAEDCVQAVFIVLARKAGSVKCSGSLGPWLYGLARNVSMRALKSRAVRTRREEGAAEMRESARPEAEVHEGQAPRIADVYAHLESLSAKQREAVVLRYLEGRSEKEAAAAVGCSVAALSRRAADGIAKLRRRLALRAGTFSAVAIIALLETEAQAALPAAITPSTVAASALAAKGAVAGGAASATLALAEGAIKIMAVAKMKLAGLIAATVVLALAGTTYVVGEAMRGKAAADAPAAVSADVAPAAAAAQTEKTTVDLGGTKALVAFEAYFVREGAREVFDRALKDADVNILKTYHYGKYLLLDCGRADPAAVLARVPYHAGAIIFREGAFVKAVASHDSKRIPAGYAVLRWGSTSTGMSKMERDIAKYSNMDGLIAEKLSSVPEGVEVAGNPTYLKLTPGKGKTLLEVFLLAEAQFDYVHAPNVTDNGEAAVAHRVQMPMAVVATWDQLKRQPRLELEGGVTVRLGIEAREVPRGCGALVYCLTEGFDRPTKWSGGDRIGPLRVTLSLPGGIETLSSASETARAKTILAGTRLYVFPCVIAKAGDYRVTLRTPSGGKTVAVATLTGSDRLYHPWTPFGRPAAASSRPQESAGDEARNIARISNAVYGAALPYWDGMAPLPAGRGSQGVVRAHLEGKSNDGDRLPTLDPTRSGAAVEGWLLLSKRDDLLHVRSDVALEKRRAPVEGEPPTLRADDLRHSRSGVEFLTCHPDRHFLARWWINGTPFVPSRQERCGLRASGKVTTGNRLDLLLEFDPARFEAAPGDRIGLQLLYCRDGWEFAADEMSKMVNAILDEGPRFLLSNRIEFVAE